MILGAGFGGLYAALKLEAALSRLPYVDGRPQRMNTRTTWSIAKHE
jgi:NADH dehydrogenase FAD-containing subunit